MKNLIREFYETQESLLNQMNAQHSFFIDKQVTITIKSKWDETIRKDVIFKGFTMDSGYVDINWKNIKSDGSESKLGGSQTLFAEDSVLITLSHNTTK